MCLRPGNYIIIDKEMEHYKECMCLKETNTGPKDPTEQNYKDVTGCKLHSTQDEPPKYLCVLPKNHNGRCAHKLNFLFEPCCRNQVCKSIDNAIYSTPGNDDYVYKNRCSRIWQIVLSSGEQKKIRDKTKKKKCAIPLKEYSTPLHLACAYLDWVTYILNIQEIKNDYISEILLKDEDYIKYFNNHKIFLKEFYESFNRVVFDNNGFTVCPVTRYLFKLKDVADKTRDSRVDIMDTDMQLGHVVPRNEENITIKEMNLVPMTRRGNRIVGDNVFTDNLWVEDLRSILNNF